ncbi:hypothetical protein BHE74_00046267 [Ensete ventricosum]|nr:hypothetical protein BHE74_00046267 [Ensete ventricosum]RZS22869.1 hypothetical protein BHM03_00055706 [Ensete ventricosum]
MPVLPKLIQNVDEKQLPQTRTLLGTGGDLLFVPTRTIGTFGAKRRSSGIHCSSPGRGSSSSPGSGGCHTRLKKGTQQGRLQFSGLWRLPHTARPGGRKQGSESCRTRLKTGKQQGRLQFAGLWRLPHTARPRGRKQER